MTGILNKLGSVFFKCFHFLESFERFLDIFANCSLKIEGFKIKDVRRKNYIIAYDCGAEFKYKPSI